MRAFRVKRYKVVKEGELERAIKVGLFDRKDVGAILVILDADDDCPKEIGPRLLNRAKEETTLPVSVVIARKEL
ncbi:MAG: hypothetical protein V1753_06285, partial [Pseudomonadota bacterium]